MEDLERKLAMPAETHYKVPESVAASDMSFVMEKDQPKSEAESEVFAEPAKEDLDETQNSPKSLALQENAENDYPKTFKLVTILVAVMLAVFLVALDMVSLICPSQILSTYTYSTL
jgi:formate-dependent nitrite reductase cytochrome c552 subunit